jgi:hypothetical protein
MECTARKASSFSLFGGGHGDILIHIHNTMESASQVAASQRVQCGWNVILFTQTSCPSLVLLLFSLDVCTLAQKTPVGGVWKQLSTDDAVHGCQTARENQKCLHSPSCSQPIKSRPQQYFGCDNKDYRNTYYLLLTVANGKFPTRMSDLPQSFSGAHTAMQEMFQDAQHFVLVPGLIVLLGPVKCDTYIWIKRLGMLSTSTRP